MATRHADDRATAADGMSRPRLVAFVLSLLGLAQPALARTLAVEVEVLHLAGQLTPVELDSLLASPQLRIEAHYASDKLIDGVTARRERVLPLGSRLFALGQITTLTGAQVARQGRTLRFSVADSHPAHASYRLQALRLTVPRAPASGRPESDLEITLADPLQRRGAHEAVFLSRNHPAFEVGLRLRYRWDDAQGDYVLAPLACDAGIEALGGGRYRFRPEQKLLRLVRTTEFGSPGQKIPAGAQRFLLSPPYPAPVGDWQVSDQQLVQVRVEGRALEYMTLQAERRGPDGCRYMRRYDAWFADGRPVLVKRAGWGLHTESCEEPKGDGGTVELRWNDDATLGYFMESTRLATRLWDEARAGNAACAGQGENMQPPTAAEVESIRDEFARLRAAFLKGGKP